MWLAALVPVPSLEVRLWKPALIDVNDMMALTIQLEHLLCIEGAAYSVILRVSSIADALDTTVAELELLLHGTQHSSLRYRKANLLVYQLLDHLS